MFNGRKFAVRYAPYQKGYRAPVTIDLFPIVLAIGVIIAALCLAGLL